MQRRKRLTNSIMAAVFAALMGVLSQISIPIGAVPLTLQTLVAALAGIILGKNWGTVIMLVWMLLGVVGIPVFAYASSGPAILLGPTGGYIIGFLFISYLSGVWVQQKNSFWLNFLLSLLANACCFLFGLVVFILYFHYGLNKELTVFQALMLTVVPFIPSTLIKAALAGVLGLKIKHALYMAGLVHEE